MVFKFPRVASPIFRRSFGFTRAVYKLQPSKKLTTPNGITYEQPTGLFINGEFVAARSGKEFEVISPSTEKKIVDLAEAGKEDIDDAVAAAKAATLAWEHVSVDERAGIIRNIAALIEKHKDTFAAVETWDNGKTLGMSSGDVEGVIGCFKYYAGFVGKHFGKVVDVDVDSFNYTRREPVGVCGMVIPWNFPLMMLAWKIAPALACGNTVILKSAESTPLTALLFASLMNEAGIPKGVVNIVSGAGEPGGYISAHPEINKVAFTGSTATGRKVLEASAKSNLKKVTLELGGKSPNIVFDDADFEQAIESVLIGIFYNQGEVCCAGTRLFVQAGIKEKFLEALKSRVDNITIGDPFDPNSFYGAQTNRQQFDKVMEYIDEGKNEAHILTGGHRRDGDGFFVQPTIFYDVKNNHKIAQEEIFGPVLAAITFNDVDEVIKMANDTPYGLAAGVHTTNLNRALYVANHLKAGTVWVNCYNVISHHMPFGGYKESGHGRELGAEVLNNYTEVKAVRIGQISSGIGVHK